MCKADAHKGQLNLTEIRNRKFQDKLYGNELDFNVCEHTDSSIFNIEIPEKLITLQAQLQYNSKTSP